ncbi:MAG: cytochrome c biogenesis protein CcsA [Alphaproteobacteria bacterium]|nr:cytochrome c biogenesis protein CcsA [Alphaproteobacteria bacterium]MDA7988744.1 cytochrome c biogenesis protein CcsA [Alphaproteobacteria bacterium]MDA8030313.1 cytochrome c biogenesis protein CcsA [Alphaproteobacteria bacterium]
MSPQRLRRASAQLLAATAIVAILGAIWSLQISPPDWRQGDAVRIMYVHVPGAWMSLICWTLMAALGAKLLWRCPPSHRAATAAAFTTTAAAGFWFTALTLATGSIWGRAIWGLWWAWDARLTAELILLFLYGAVLALLSSFASEWRGIRAAAILALFGLLHLPVIKFSVEWWISLHQGSSVFAPADSRLPPDFLAPLAVMTLVYLLFLATLITLRVETALIKETTTTPPPEQDK